jgi:hypothetical protein
VIAGFLITTREPTLEVDAQVASQHSIWLVPTPKTMTILYHWRGENYRKDIQGIRPGDELTLEQNSPTMSEIEPGEQLWAFTRRGDGPG